MRTCNNGKLVSNTAIAVFANAINLILSVINTLIIPETVGVFGYGNYQYFIMLTSFSWLFQFGIVWGFYLKYGGTDYKVLDKKLFSVQFRVYATIEIVVALAGFILITAFVNDSDRAFVLFSFFIYTFVVIIKLYFQHILTLSNQIKKFSLLTLAERIIAFVFVIVLILSHIDNYKYYILCELSANVLFLFVYVFMMKEISFGKAYSLKKGLTEALDNFKIGINLTFVDAATILIMSSCRIIIDNRWDIQAFAQISIAVAISNFVTTIVNAISTALFPFLKVQSDHNRKEKYSVIRSGIDVLCITVMFLYYFVITIVSRFLPSYTDGLSYLIYFVPICFMNTKSLLLCGTYFKTLRLEKMYLRIELCALLLNIVLATVSAYVYNSLLMVVISLLVVMIIKAETEDIFISRYFKILFKQSVIKEIVNLVLFIMIFAYISNILGVLLYVAISLAMYFADYKSLIKKTLGLIKS